MNLSKPIILGLVMLSILISAQAEAQVKMSLASFIQKVKEQNLDLKISSTKSLASDAEAIGINLPAPMLSFDQMKMQSGMTANGFEVSQTIPFPTKLSNEHSARKYAALSQKEEFLAKQNETLAQAKLLYFSLWENQERIELLREKKQIISNHIRLSRAVARSDSFTNIHTLKAESDLDLLENRIENEEQLAIDLQTKVAVFLDEDPEKFQLITDEPPLAAIPEVEVGASHQLQSIKYKLKNAEAKQSQAKSEWFPDLQLQYKEMGPTDVVGRYSEVMVGISLPFVYFWEPYAKSEKAKAENMQVQFEFEKTKRDIEGEKIFLINRIQSLKKQISRLTESLIPRAEKRMKIARNLAARDLETLQDRRETMEAFPDLKIEVLNLELEYEKAVISLERYRSDKGLDYE